jgi:hypothetical protein
LARDLAIQELFPAIGNDQVLVACIEAHVVGVRTKRGRLQKLKRGAVEDFHHAVALGGNEQVVVGASK